MTMFSDIIDFHEKFGLEYRGPPRTIPKSLADFRLKFMGEELVEYVGGDERDQSELQDILQVAADQRDDVPLADKLDALVDLVYVALGTAYLHGFDFDEAWRRVHAANMAKVRAQVDGSDSKRRSEFDVVKPPGWRPADLSDLVVPR